jgi:ABC-type enterochelin transport system ATPase subunit
MIPVLRVQDVRFVRDRRALLDDVFGHDSTTHAILLREGEVLASGVADDVLTTELISACFDHPITIDRSGGRWTARAA